MINSPVYPEYTMDTIENIMSLRKPQIRSIKILNQILDEIELSKNLDLESAKSTIHDIYPIFSDFEHNFMSLTFALATGVGKTKLMGAFITYLYTNKGIKNFFVVAPNLTIYSKLKNDLGNPAIDNEKYVFKGVGCFATKIPNVWTDDDYRTRPLYSAQTVYNDSINIFIFNISKFNSEENKMKSINEYLGQSFFDYLKSLDDLVLIMDESHHYRAKSSSQAINELNPVLGLELTATPQIQSGSKTILFKNVVYEYALSQAIKDGYTRTPYALTRKDIKTYNLTEDELDKTMINDGIFHHENIKTELLQYAKNNNAKIIKPFMLIVCKDTKHAEKVLNYVKSDAFKNGFYKDKVIMIHSNQTGTEKDENVKLLLEVEKSDNPIEIVIHVNILKEGWDVNNLYTIVPLRTATSKTLREQTVGRGLRLPYGKRTGDKMVDSVTITAHDKFDEIIAEAQREDSIFKAEGIIYADYELKKQIKPVQLSIDMDEDDEVNKLKSVGIDTNNEKIMKVYSEIKSSLIEETNNNVKESANYVISKEKIKEKVYKDIGQRYKDNENITKELEAIFGTTADDIIDNTSSKIMYIPQIKTENFAGEKYIIQDFNLDLSDMNYTPIANDILIKNLFDTKENAIFVSNNVIDYDTINPEKILVSGIRQVNEIDYEKCPELIQKIVMQFLRYYREKYSEEKVRNICLMYRKDIINNLKNQILQHLAVSYEGLIEVIEGIKTVICDYVVDVSNGITDIYEEPNEKNISSMVYYNAKKSLTNYFKFDSNPERIFAISCENSPEVINWLRPSPKQFNITYNRGHRYEPDFVVETKDMYYLVEIKAKNKMNDVDVLAKKERAIEYCAIASEYNESYGHKQFKYLFIPHDEVSYNSSFNNLKDRFIEK